MGTFYDNNDLIKLAEKVRDLYKNKDIINYVHNGKRIPPKYEKLIERKISCSNVAGEKSLQTVLTNAIKFSFNQATQLNTTVAAEHRTYRESCERNRIILASLKKKKSLGDNSVDDDIDKKEEEIKLLQKKIDEIATLSAAKPEYNKNILSVAEEAYNLLLRTDKTPYYFYAEICKKLGYRVNLDQLFSGFRDRDNIVNVKKKEIDDDNEDYKNFMEMNVKKGAYVPPAFRKNEQEQKINRLENIMKKEDKQNEKQESIKDIKKDIKKEEKEEFPEFIQNVQTNRNLGAWGKKITIIPDPPKEISTDTQDILDTQNVQSVQNVHVTPVPKEILKEVPTQVEKITQQNSWEDNNGWESMDTY
jgi:hypothetical protein